MNPTRLVSIALAAVLPLAACGSSPPPKKEPVTKKAKAALTADQKLAKAIDAFLPEYYKRHPTFAADLGVHEFDGKLPDVSGEALPETIAWHQAQLAAFEGFDPSGLGTRQKVEREAVINRLQRDLFQLETIEAPTRNPMYYVGFLGLDGYISRDYAPLEQRARGVIGIASGATDHLLAAQANLPGSMPRPWIDTALLMTNGHIAFARKDVAAAFAELQDAKLLEELAAALAAYGDALTNYKQFLEKARKTASNDFALGPEKYAAMLALEGVTIDLAQLEAIGNADLERNTATLAAAAAAMKKSIPKAIQLVDTDRPKPAEVIATATQQAAETRQFLIDKSIVSIPSEDVAEVTETPVFARWNFAFLSAPGAFEEKALPAFYWISPPDPSWPKKEQLDYIAGKADLLFTTIHELWPGHFLHHLHMKKVPSKALRAFCAYSMTEGWAHYTEEMMLEEGYGGGDPKIAIGMAVNALLRDARFLSSIGLHTKGMTVEQSTKLFTTKAFTGKREAMQQAARGTFDPGYLNYTLGKLMIRKLRDDWKAKQGDKYSLKAFHDELLSYGCAPLPTIRRAMLGDDSPAL